MFQGFYTLGSAMISENRNLNVISNNMANAATNGYKSDKYIASTFREEVLYRSGNITPNKRTPIGTTAMIQATNDRVTSYEQGGMDPTEMPLDVAINGNGFFAVQKGTGADDIVYTRSGSFITDDEGYIAVPNIGRVLGTNNAPIQVDTDDLVIDIDGTVRSEVTGTVYGTIRLDDFEDYDEALVKGDNGTFVLQEGATARAGDGQIVQGMLERSNVSMVEEMTSMMSAQRSLQAAAQLIKMYDQLDARTVTLGGMS